MIYLFDEQDNRRRDFGWSDDKINSFDNCLKLFDKYDFLEDNTLLKGNCDIVFRHESFFDKVQNEKKQLAKEMQDRIDKACKLGKIKQIVFSGSKMSRKIENNIAFLPVSVFYQNLEFFIGKYINNEWNINDIVYGKNKSLEENILNGFRKANKSIGEDDNQWGLAHGVHDVLFIKVIDPKISKPSFFQTDEVGVYYDLTKNEPISDSFLHCFVSDELSRKKYDKVFIPLCFGPVLSDFNGLRLALHIRTTEGPNQFSKLYIYSPIDINCTIYNEYFDILKTANVYLIDYSCKALYNALLQENTSAENDIRKTLSLINLQPPKNYLDSHSIANEWAIYRWSQTLGENIQNEEITKIIEEIDHNLYYKYLKTLYPPQDIEKLDASDLDIDGITKDMTGKDLDEPSILFVDDEAERGWYVLFKEIITRNNPNLYIDYLGKKHFVDKSQDEIVNIIVNKVKEDDFNIVILDFRLHSDDSYAVNIDGITGYKALCKIKEYNSGIQVIILSATNKVWNLQKLQEKDANGFVLKESPYNSLDKSFTSRSIKSFIKVTSHTVQNCFKKMLFEQCNQIIRNINKHEIATDDHEKMLKLFHKQINLVKKSIARIDIWDKNSIDIIYVALFNILENFKLSFLKESKNREFSLGIDSGVVYKIEDSDRKKKIHRMQSPVLINRMAKNNGEIINPSLFDFLGSYLIYCGISQSTTQDSSLKKMWDIVNWRNDFIHDNKKDHFSKNELMIMVDMLESISKHMKP